MCSIRLSKSTSFLALNTNAIRAWAGPYTQTLAEFERIRVVGKGAFGTAVLYRKVCKRMTSAFSRLILSSVTTELSLLLRKSTCTI